MSNISQMRNKLLIGSATAVLTAMGGGLASAATTNQESAQSLIGVIQTGDNYSIGATITENDGSAGVSTSGNVADSTITVGTSATTRNVTSATGTSNEATLTVTNAINNDTQIGETLATADTAGVTAETATSIPSGNWER